MKGLISIRSCVRSVVIIALLGLVCSAMAAHEWQRHAAATEVFKQKAELLVETAARSFSGLKDCTPASMREGCSRLLDYPQILSAAVFDDRAGTVAVVCRDSCLQEQLIPPKAGRAPAVLIEIVHVKGDQGRGSEQFARAYAHMPMLGGCAPLTLGILAPIDTSALAISKSIWQFHLPLACIAIGGIYVVDSRLRKQVVARVLALAGGQTSDAPFSELEAVAERIGALEASVRTWKTKAEAIERRAGTDMTNETKRIMRDLTRVQKEAWIDPLTGIHNRRFLEEKYPAMYEAQREAGRDLSLVMIDLDNFKRLNDTKGHAAGDSVLAFVGDLLRQCLRGDDCAVRYGGDEFVVILPGVCADNAKILAERLLSLFNQHAKTMFSGTVSVSMTAGIAGMRQNEPRSASELLACADDALLAAKQAGKKRALLSTSRGDDQRATSHSEGRKPRRSTSVTMNL